MSIKYDSDRKYGDKTTSGTVFFAKATSGTVCKNDVWYEATAASVRGDADEEPAEPGSASKYVSRMRGTELPGNGLMRADRQMPLKRLKVRDEC